MREMKDSGIEWIGKIPKDWKVNRCKNISNFINGYAFDSKAFQNDFLYSVIRIGDIKEGYIDNIKWLGVSNNKGLDRYLIKENDILLAMSGATVGKVGIAHGIKDAYINQRVGIIRTTSPRFLFYYLSTREFIEYILLRADGSAQPNVSGDVYGEFYIPYPRLEEQNNISDYLDTKCSEIDSTAEDIQKEICLLEDYKKSVITEAVTKGLNPDVEMKDSGIEWIGEIPQDWEVEKIKYNLRRNEPKNPGNTIVLSVYREYGVIPKDSRDDNHNVTSEDTSKYKFLRKGDLVINKMKAWQGSLAVSDYEGIVSPAYFIYEFKTKKVLNKYMHYLLRSCYKEELKRISGGIREGQWDLSSDEFENTLILLPPFEVQNDIVEFIKRKELELDSLISDKKKQLEILAEYKKSLIYEYVTGKKEVPES